MTKHYKRGQHPNSRANLPAPSSPPKRAFGFYLTTSVMSAARASGDNLSQVIDRYLREKYGEIPQQTPTPSDRPHHSIPNDHDETTQDLSEAG